MGAFYRGDNGAFTEPMMYGTIEVSHIRSRRVVLYLDVDDGFTERFSYGTIEVSHSFQSFETGCGFEFFLGF